MEPPMVKVGAEVHSTEMEVTSAVGAGPEPLVTRQVALAGCVLTVTLYAPAGWSGNEKMVFWLSTSGLAPLFCSVTVSPAGRPVSRPPMR